MLETSVAGQKTGAIRVLLVDDSPLALALQQKMLATAPDIAVAGTASHGREALRMLPELRPHIVCTDFHMPVMDGLQLVQEIMATAPLPILVVSSLSQPDDRRTLLPLVAAGALDVFHKPDATQSFEETARALVAKIRVLAGVYVFSRRVFPALEKRKIASIEYSMLETPRESSTKTPETGSSNGVRVVGVGASTGGPQVLHEIFSQLPADFPLPILCVQHISAGFSQGLIEWLSGAARVRVKAMQEGEIARPGTVYFPIEGRHMTLDAQMRLLSSDAPFVDGHRPSVTSLFSSLAKNHGASVLAILLTGMGNDGARGLLEIAQAGGRTIAQDEASSVVFGMPRQAIALGAAQRVLSIGEIARALQNSAHVKTTITAF